MKTPKTDDETLLSPSTCSPEFVCDGCGEEYLGEPYVKNGCKLCLHCKDVQLYTKRHIADYIAGWTMGSFDEVTKLGQRVAHNALHHLGCEQDGIEAVVRRGASKANAESLPPADTTEKR